MRLGHDFAEVMAAGAVDAVAILAGSVDPDATVDSAGRSVRVLTCWPRPVARVVARLWSPAGPLAGRGVELDAGGVELGEAELVELWAGRLPAVLSGWPARVGPPCAHDGRCARFRVRSDAG